MDSHWVNDRAGYRCRHGHTSAKTRAPDQPGNLYVREDRLLDLLASRLRLADHKEIRASLKAQRLVIVFGLGGVALEPNEGSSRSP